MFQALADIFEEDGTIDAKGTHGPGNGGVRRRKRYSSKSRNSISHVPNDHDIDIEDIL